MKNILMGLIINSNSFHGMAASGFMFKNGLKDVRRNLTPVRFRLMTVQAV